MYKDPGSKCYTAMKYRRPESTEYRYERYSNQSGNVQNQLKMSATYYKYVKKRKYVIHITRMKIVLNCF